jgi:hypothetical protein
MNAVEDQDNPEHSLHDVIESAKSLSPNGFILNCHRAVFETESFKDAESVSLQQLFLRVLMQAIEYRNDYEYIQMARTVYETASSQMRTTILVERGEVFMYPMDPIRTADGKLLPDVTVFDMTDEDSPPVVKSPGHVFNDTNVEIWMKTLVMCCHRRGYNRINDVLRSDIMDYIKHARIIVAEVYVKDPNLSARGMRVVLPEGTYVPGKRMNGRMFYFPMEETPCILPHEALSGPQLVYAIVSGMREGRITRGTAQETLVYYENALYNFVLKYPASRYRKVASDWLRTLTSWTG